MSSSYQPSVFVISIGNSINQITLYPKISSIELYRLFQWQQWRLNVQPWMRKKFKQDKRNALEKITRVRGHPLSMTLTQVFHPLTARTMHRMVKKNKCVDCTSKNFFHAYILFFIIIKLFCKFLTFYIDNFLLQVR